MVSLLRVSTACMIAFTALFALPESTFSQDQDRDFTTVKSEWSVVEKSLKQTEAAIAGGDSTKDAEFRDLVDQANGLIDELRTAGIAALKSDRKNREAARTLMGIMVNDAFFGRDAEAVRLGDQLIEVGLNPRYFEVASENDRLTPSAKEIFYELRIRSDEARSKDLPRVRLETTQGDIVLELFENEAPNTVANFITLVEDKFYQDIFFHRVMENFMAQTGCPEGTGQGGPGYNIACECYSPDARKHFTGSLSMAKQTPRDTGGSQFYVTLKRTSHLDGLHTVFGRIVSGWDVVDNLARTHEAGPMGRDIEIKDVIKDKIKKAVVIRKRDHKYRVRKVGEAFEEESPEPPSSLPEINAPEMNDENQESDSEESDEDKDESTESTAEESSGESDGDASESEEGDVESDEKKTSDEDSTSEDKKSDKSSDEDDDDDDGLSRNQS